MVRSGLTAEQKSSLNKSVDEMKLSPTEADKFQKAFKDPEFLRMFEEYAKQMEDPAAKAESEAYLRQVESEGQVEQVYGKGAQLIVPEPHFVVKTRVQGDGTKIFVNVCSSLKVREILLENHMRVYDCFHTSNFHNTLHLLQSVANSVVSKLTHDTNACVFSFRPHISPQNIAVYELAKAEIAPSTSQEVTTDGKPKGVNWSIPLSLSPKRGGQDRTGEACWVYDFTVHPDVLPKALSNTRFMDIVMDSAFERIEEVAKCKLQRNYRKLNMKFKATASHQKPAVQALRGQDAQVSNGRLKPVSSTSADPGVTIDASKQPTARATRPGGRRSDFSFASKGQKENQRVPKKATDPGFKHPCGLETPKYEIVQSGFTDLADTWKDPNLRSRPPHPKRLLLRVELPGLTSVSGVNLDVGSTHVVLKVEGRFLLEADLPYKVRENDGKAKFDKTHCRLELTLPVIPPPEIHAKISCQTELVREADCTHESQQDTSGCRAPPEDAEMVDSNKTHSSRTELQPIDGDTSGETSRADITTPSSHKFLSMTEAAIEAADSHSQHSNTSACIDPIEEGIAESAESITANDVAAASTAPGTESKIELSDLKSLAQRWTKLNRDRDAADQKALNCEKAYSALEACETQASDYADPKAAKQETCPSPQHSQDRQSTDDVGRSSYGAALSAAGLQHNDTHNSITLAPALQMSFAEELD